MGTQQEELPGQAGAICDGCNAVGALCWLAPCLGDPTHLLNTASPTCALPQALQQHIQAAASAATDAVLCPLEECLLPEDEEGDGNEEECLRASPLRGRFAQGRPLSGRCGCGPTRGAPLTAAWKSRDGRRVWHSCDSACRGRWRVA